MARPFLYVLSVLLVLNLIYKSFIFFSYDKVPGKIIGFDGFTAKYERTSRYSGEKVTSYEFVKTPLVAFEFDGLEYEVTKEKWGYIDSFKEGDVLTVMIGKKSDAIEINSFFQFWFTFYDIALGFGICFVVTIVLGIILPERKPRVWKNSKVLN